MPLYEHIAIGLVVALQVATIVQLFRLTAKTAMLAEARKELCRRIRQLELHK